MLGRCWENAFLFFSYFSIIPLDRKDPEEQILVNMLLGLEQDLADYEDKPMVFPIYGRGTVKYALIGGGIQ